MYVVNRKAIINSVVCGGAYPAEVNFALTTLLSQDKRAKKRSRTSDSDATIK